MIYKSVLKLLLVVFVILMPTSASNAAPKKPILKEGATCTTFGKIFKKMQCANVNGKNIWQSITLTNGSKIYPSENSECFFFKNIIVLGKAASGDLIQLECVWDNGIIGSKAHWISNQWTYKKALNDSSRSVIANAWKSIVSMHKSKNKLNIL